MKLVGALEAAGIELIAENARAAAAGVECAQGGDAVMTVVISSARSVGLMLAGAAVAIGRSPAGSTIIYGGSLLLAVVSLVVGTIHLLGHRCARGGDLAARASRIGAHFRLTRSPRSSS